MSRIRYQKVTAPGLHIDLTPEESEAFEQMRKLLGLETGKMMRLAIYNGLAAMTSAMRDPNWLTVMRLGLEEIDDWEREIHAP